jgi:hypothetical protein
VLDLRELLARGELALRLSSKPLQETRACFNRRYPGVGRGAGVGRGRGVRHERPSGCLSSEPISMRPLMTRGQPRWSLEGGEWKFGSPASIARLPHNNACRTSYGVVLKVLSPPYLVPELFVATIRK